jgi:hypothetical protein
MQGSGCRDRRTRFAALLYSLCMQESVAVTIRLHVHADLQAETCRELVPMLRAGDKHACLQL